MTAADSLVMNTTRSKVPQKHVYPVVAPPIGSTEFLDDCPSARVAPNGRQFDDEHEAGIDAIRIRVNTKSRRALWPDG